MFGIAHIVVAKPDNLFDLHECSPWELAVAKGRKDAQAVIERAVASWPVPEYTNQTQEQVTEILKSSDCSFSIKGA